MTLAFGTYPPLGSGTSDAIGAVQYGKPGVGFPAVGLAPFHAGAWNFAVYGSPDYAGAAASNTLRCVVDGPGTITIHTATYLVTPCTLAATLRFDNGTGIESTQTGITTGTDIVFTVPDDGHAHAIDVTDTAGSGKWGFAGFTWSPPLSAGVFADWGDDGFGADYSDDDLTGDVESWTVTRGASAEITGSANVGSATIVLNNRADDRYNPMNPTGPLYGLLHDGVPVWIGVTSSGGQRGTDPRGVFGGRVKDVSILTTQGTDSAPQLELTCEDAFGLWGRTPAHVGDALFRTQRDFRLAVLADVGETHLDLAGESSTLPISAWDGDAMGALEALNRANGTRHFIRPSDDRTLWYDYVTRNRQWRLDGTVDATISDADAITGSSGWRLSADTVINHQLVTVDPISFTSGEVTVWEAEGLPIIVRGSTITPTIYWIAFDEFVSSPRLDIAYSLGGGFASVLEAFGRTAKITLMSYSATDVYALSIEGRMVRRGLAESAVEDDLASQGGGRGVRAGSEIAGDLVGVIATARGLAAHVVWRYGTPQYRPTITVEDWLPEMLEVDLYDVIASTVGQLGMSGSHYEIVGLTMAWTKGMPLPSLTYVLQECRVQADPGWFVLDASLLDGTDILAY